MKSAANSGLPNKKKISSQEYSTLDRLRKKITPDTLVYACYYRAKIDGKDYRGEFSQSNGIVLSKSKELSKLTPDTTVFQKDGLIVSLLRVKDEMYLSAFPKREENSNKLPVALIHSRTDFGASTISLAYNQTNLELSTLCVRVNDAADNSESQETDLTLTCRGKVLSSLEEPLPATTITVNKKDTRFEKLIFTSENTKVFARSSRGTLQIVARAKSDERLVLGLSSFSLFAKKSSLSLPGENAGIRVGCERADGRE